MKKFNLSKIFFLVMALCTVIACNDDAKAYYEVKANEVVYHSVYRKGQEYYTEAHKLAQPVVGADAKTFYEISTQYGADTTHVFHRATKLEDRDPISFEVINKFITTDKFGVYVENKKIENSDGLSFQFENGRFALDKNQAYHFTANKYGILKNVDLETFEALDYNYAKDVSNVYFNNYIIENASSKYFELLGYDYAKDNKHVYHKNIRITDVDYATFRLIERDSIKFNETIGATVFAEDKNFYYKEAEAIKK